MLVPIKIFQFQDMLKENRFLGTFRGQSKWPKTKESSLRNLVIANLANIKPMTISAIGLNILPQIIKRFKTKLPAG